MRRILLLLSLVFFSGSIQAQDALVVTTCGTLPQTYSAGSTRQPTVDVNGNLCSETSSSSGTIPWIPTLNGTPQYGLSVGTNTQLTVPVSTKCAEITVETANVRYTEDGTSASTTNGQLVSAGTSFQYCATSLAALKFTAVSGSPTIDVSYFK